VPHKDFAPKALNFLPDWMLAYDFPHNVNEAGVRLANCTDSKYCEHLPVPVFPTSFYETIICLLLFLILWALRKKLKIPGTLFAVYLMLNGIERFFIEKIRVNNKMNFPGHPTQAELISAFLFLSGLIIYILLRRRANAPVQQTPVQP
jgi:prolipoprotein diacylglyceryltransferase